MKPKSLKRKHLKRSKINTKKRSNKRVMRGCSMKGGNSDFNVPISKFYPLNDLKVDVQRNSEFDNGLKVGGGYRKKQRYSRKYLKGGAVYGLTPLEYSSPVNSSPIVQPIMNKFTDQNPYLV